MEWELFKKLMLSSVQDDWIMAFSLLTKDNLEVFNPGRVLNYLKSNFSISKNYQKYSNSIHLSYKTEHLDIRIYLYSKSYGTNGGKISKIKKWLRKNKSE